MFPYNSLKQRSCECSVVFTCPAMCFSGDSPSSLSPRDNDPNRHVTFNAHVDSTTFKTNASVSSMKQALKSKRRNQRKREEKRKEKGGRRRHSSTGSEGSSCDEGELLRSSESTGEDDGEPGRLLSGCDSCVL